MPLCSPCREDSRAKRAGGDSFKSAGVGSNPCKGAGWLPDVSGLNGSELGSGAALCARAPAPRNSWRRWRPGWALGHEPLRGVLGAPAWLRGPPATQRRCWFTPMSRRLTPISTPTSATRRRCRSGLEPQESTSLLPWPSEAGATRPIPQAARTALAQVPASIADAVGSSGAAFAAPADGALSRDTQWGGGGVGELMRAAAELWGAGAKAQGCSGHLLGSTIHPEEAGEKGSIGWYWGGANGVASKCIGWKVARSRPSLAE